MASGMTLSGVSTGRRIGPSNPDGVQQILEKIDIPPRCRFISYSLSPGIKSSASFESAGLGVSIQVLVASCISAELLVAADEPPFTSNVPSRLCLERVSRRGYPFVS